LPDERYGNELDYYDGETAQIEEPEREIPIVSNAWHEPDEIDETLRLSDLELNDI
jgi:hypothetical protein